MKEEEEWKKENDYIRRTGSGDTRRHRSNRPSGREQGEGGKMKVNNSLQNIIVLKYVHDHC